MTFIEWLVERDACSDGIEWAKTNKISSASRAWAKLQRPDWMLWMVRKAGVKMDDAKLRHFAADCAEAVLPIFEKEHPDDKHPRLVIQAARDYADGKISDAAKAAASDAAWDAAWAAARAATRATAWAAARATAMDVARAAAKAAAKAAASDAAKAAASDAAWDAAWAATRAATRATAMTAAMAAAMDAQAKNLRKYFKNPFKGWNPATQTAPPPALTTPSKENL